LATPHPTATLLTSLHKLMGFWNIRNRIVEAYLEQAGDPRRLDFSASLNP
jgi:hypothetical protein